MSASPEGQANARVVGGTLAVLRDGAAWHGATLTPEMCEALLAVLESKEKLHRRAQRAEARASARPDLVTLELALRQLSWEKSERHRLAQEVRFMQSERRRLHETVADLRARQGASDAVDSCGGGAA